MGQLASGYCQRPHVDDCYPTAPHFLMLSTIVRPLPYEEAEAVAR